MSRTRDIATILGATEASNTSNVALLNTNSSVGLDSSQVSTIAGAEGIATYDSTGALPVSHNVGDQAFVTGVSRLYFSNGSGWYSQDIINANPRWADSVGSGIGEPNGTLTIVDSATPLIVKAVGVDSDALPLTTSVTLPDSAQYVFTTSSDSSVFTFTPKTLAQAQASSVAGLIDSNVASIDVTFKVTDGISILSKPAIITYQWLSTSIGERNMFGSSGMITLGYLDGTTNIVPYRCLYYCNASDPGYFMCTVDGYNPPQGDAAPVRTYRVNATGTGYHTNANATGSTTMPTGDSLSSTRQVILDPAGNYAYGGGYFNNNIHRGTWNGSYTSPSFGAFSAFYTTTGATATWGGTLGHDGNAMFNNQENVQISGSWEPTVKSVQMTGASYGAANASTRDLGFATAVTSANYDVAVCAFDPYSQCYYYMKGGLYPSAVQIMDQAGTHIGSFNTGESGDNINAMCVIRDGLWVQYHSNQTKIFVRGNTANPNWNESRESEIWTAY